MFDVSGWGGGMLPLFYSEEEEQKRQDQPSMMWGQDTGRTGAGQRHAPAGGFFGADSGSPFAEGNQHAQDMGNAWDMIKQNPANAALLAGLSMLANNNGRRSFGQLVGQSGIDTLGGLGQMAATQQAQEQQRAQQAMAQNKMQEDARQRQFQNQLLAGKFGLDANKFGFEQQKYAQEQAQQRAGQRALNQLIGGGAMPAAGGDGRMPPWQQNNNPLNLKTTDGGWRQFGNMDESWPAYQEQLARYQQRGITTPAQMIATWAPASDGNDVAGYVKNVGAWTGLDMNAPIDMRDPAQASRLMAGMARMESGQQFQPERIQAALPGQQMPAQTGVNAGSPVGGGYGPAANAGNALQSPFLNLDRQKLMQVAMLGGDAGKRAQWLLEQQDRQNKLQIDYNKDRRAQEKEDAKEAEAQRKLEARNDQAQKYSNVVLEDIGRAKRMATDYAFIPNTGLTGAATSWIGGTTAHDLDKTIDTLRSNISFDRLQEMRAASPTGGALGAVSDTENKMLQAALGSLEQSQSEDEFLYNLNRIEKMYANTVHGTGNWYHDNSGNIVTKSMSGMVMPPSLSQDVVNRFSVNQQQGSAPYNGGQMATSHQSGGGQRLRFNPQTGRLE